VELALWSFFITYLCVGRVGSRRGGGSSAGNVKFATTNYDMDARATGPIVDSKFEGHSNLAQAAEKTKLLQSRRHADTEKDAIHEDIILNLHK